MDGLFCDEYSVEVYPVPEAHEECDLRGVRYMLQGVVGEFAVYYRCGARPELIVESLYKRVRAYIRAFGDCN